MADNTLKRYCANSLDEIFKIVENITLFDQMRKNNSSPLWFRASSKSHYGLVPSLLREDSDKQMENSNKSYSVLHLREDYRYQHFRAKCNQLIKTSPEVKLEWQEIMRHYWTKTRLLDWTETLMTALIFALEPFLDSRQEETLKLQRKTITPAIWVLNPYRLNEHIYDLLCQTDVSGSYPYILEATKELFISENCNRRREIKHKIFAKKIGDELSNNKNIYFSVRENGISDCEIDGIVCLATIEADRIAHLSRLYNMLENQSFNPFFYLLLRYYADGIITPAGKLPPLATVNPYHNSRIEAQHGVFTLTPNYELTEQQKSFNENLGIDYMDMSRHPLINDCLSQIRITRPARVAKDILTIGGRVTEIYPELDRYAQVIETSKYYI